MKAGQNEADNVFATIQKIFLEPCTNYDRPISVFEEGAMQKFLMALLIMVTSMAIAKEKEMSFLDDNKSIQSHMQEMYDLREAAFADLIDPDKGEDNADKIAQVRAHLHAIFSKTPSSVTELPEDEQRLKRLEYQRFISQAMIVTINLESALLQEADNDDEVRAREDNIDKWAIKLMSVISTGHRNFRPSY